MYGKINFKTIKCLLGFATCYYITDEKNEIVFSDEVISMQLPFKLRKKIINNKIGFTIGSIIKLNKYLCLNTQ